ncbi:MAG: hypothetical protein AB7U73_06100 [Pirellulales bacterium]
MASGDLHLDEHTFNRVRQLAAEQNISVEQLLSEAVEQYALQREPSETPLDSMIGLFADVPDLMDQIVQQAYDNRERDPWRLPTT